MIIFPLFVADFFATRWMNFQSRPKRIVAVALCISIALPSFLHQLNISFRLIGDPSTGHEYVENAPVAQALKMIPLAGSVIATNDFRYPAEEKKRDLMQIQLAAVFGHQFYACVFSEGYERYLSSNERYAEQQRLRHENWDAEISDIARQKGWTHLLIDLSAPHSKNIPLPLIFKNNSYAVYRFDT